MTKTLQQIKDEWAKDHGYIDYKEFYELTRVVDTDQVFIMDGAMNQVAIRYAQEQNKEMLKMMESMENAWQKLPYGHNSVKDTQNWITNDLHPQILKMREYVQKHKGGKS